MRDTQVAKFGMRNDTRAAARGAARSGVEFGQAIAAQGRHVLGIRTGDDKIHPARGRQKGPYMQAFGGAKLILFIGDRIVVLRRDDRADIPWPGRLDLPGGGRDGEESPQACVLRETAEEIGLSLQDRDLVWCERYGRGVFFAAHLPAEAEDLIVFGSEGQGWSLMRAEDYARHPEAIPHFAIMVRRYLVQTFG